MNYQVIKHPQWRVNAIEHVDSRLLDSFIEDAWRCVAHYPFADSIADIEWVGSYALGTAQLHSDIDLNISMGNDRDQRLAMWQFTSGLYRPTFSKALAALQGKYGIRIEFVCVECDNKKLNPTYSTREGVFYNKAAGEIIPVTLRWDWASRSWARRPAKVVSLSAFEDPYAADVDEWREKYGKHFQEFHPHG